LEVDDGAAEEAAEKPDGEFDFGWRNASAQR